MTPEFLVWPSEERIVPVSDQEDWRGTGLERYKIKGLILVLLSLNVCHETFKWTCQVEHWIYGVWNSE